jgi:hypothetical protein
MPWLAINSRSGVSENFKRLPRIDQKRLLPYGSLPINVLDIKDLDHVLNGILAICPEGERKKKRC